MTLDFHNDPTVTDALLHWRARSTFPTDLGHVDLAGLSRELRMRSVFSARTTNADYVQEIANVVDDMLSGKINLATGRLHLMRKLKELGYDPEHGFPQDMANVPPAERGSLQDLSSERRIDLMLETNMRIAANYGRMVAGNVPSALHSFPAWELVRLYLRQVPRGTPDSHSVGWQRRWNNAGDSVAWEGALQGRMLARKDSPIWEALGAGAGGYDDCLDNPFPPFAFNSGMAWRAVPRAECIALGLIAEDETPEATDAPLFDWQKESNLAFDKLSPDLRAEQVAAFRDFLGEKGLLR